MRRQELVYDFGEELVSYEGGVGVVGDYDAADAFGAAVGVECIVYQALLDVVNARGVETLYHLVQYPAAGRAGCVLLPSY